MSSILGCSLISGVRKVGRSAKNSDWKKVARGLRRASPRHFPTRGSLRCAPLCERLVVARLPGGEETGYWMTKLTTERRSVAHWLEHPTGSFVTGPLTNKHSVFQLFIYWASNCCYCFPKINEDVSQNLLLSSSPVPRNFDLCFLVVAEIILGKAFFGILDELNVLPQVH